jgi:hypothetical protein
MIYFVFMEQEVMMKTKVLKSLVTVWIKHIISLAKDHVKHVR